MTSVRPSSPAREAPASGFEILGNEYLLEEEMYSWYKPEEWYSVKIGEIFQSKYQVIGKLGFGSVSTVWLCRDLDGHRYVTLKVFVTSHRQALNEEKVYQHLSSIKTDNACANGIRSLLDSFTLPGESGNHQCLIHEPLGLTLRDIRELSDGEKVSDDLLKPFIRYLLGALDFLHTEAKVVHTDIQEGNVMLGTEDDTIFKIFEQEEADEPSLRKIDGNRIIYASRQTDIPDNPSRAVLCDFGDAHFGKKTYTAEVMPDLYRAPEIVLGIPWNEKIDIWSVGQMVWDLYEGKHMFTERLPSRNESITAHIARMIALMGPPPKDLLDRGQRTERYFDEAGNFECDIEIKDTSLEAEEENLQGEEKKKFLRFMRKMMQWRPEDRKSARSLIDDPWLVPEETDEIV